MIQVTAARLSLIPLFGENFYERLKIVQRVCAKMEPSFGPQKTLLEQVKERKEVSCRLLYEGDRPAGVVIFQKKCSPDRYFKIDLLHVEVGFLPDVIKTVIRFAQEQKADFISVPIPSAAESIEFFKLKQFELIEEKSLLVRKLRENSPPRPMVREASPPKKKVRIVETRTQFSEECRAVRERYIAAGKKAIGCGLEAPLIKMIGDGRKKMACIPHYGAFLTIKERDFIKFSSGFDWIVCEVIEFTRYESMIEMLRQEDFREFLPENTSVGKVIKYYDQLPGMKQQVEKYGVLAVRFHPSAYVLETI